MSEKAGVCKKIVNLGVFQAEKVYLVPNLLTLFYKLYMIFISDDDILHLLTHKENELSLYGELFSLIYLIID